MSLRLFLGALASSAGRGVTRAAGRLTERGRAYRAVSRQPALTSSSAEGSHVRVTGIVRVLGESLEAPLSGRTCVAYRARVSVFHNGRTGTPRKGPPRAETLRIVPFLLEAADEVVLIDGEHMLFDVPEVTRTRAAEREHRFLLQHGFPRSVSGTFREVILEPEMLVSIAGVLMRDIALAPPSEERAFRDGPPPSARITGSRQHPLAIIIAPPP